MKLTGKERGERIKAANVCFRCLGKGHFSKGCWAKCSKCKGKHNVLMCGIRLESRPNIDNDDVKVTYELNNNDVGLGLSSNHVGVTLSNVSPPNKICTVLQTAKVQVVGANGIPYVAKLMFDNGSDRTYVASNFVKKSRPKWVASEPISYSAFGGSNSNRSKQSNIFDLVLLDCNNAPHSLVAAEIPKICQPLLRPTIPTKLLNTFSNVQLADNYLNNSHMDIDILVGLDAYWKLMIPGNIIQAEGIVAQKSVFGWVLSGSWLTPSHIPFTPSQMLCISNVSENELHKFWDLESVGICPKESIDQCESNFVLQEFSKKVSFFNGRYEVALPWKNEAAKNNLINNEKLAVKRLDKLHLKLDKDPQLKTEYYNVFHNYEQEGIIEEIPCNEIVSQHPTYYMPHRPVVRESSTSTKVRPVFDASASSYNGISLNDCLMTGPSLNPDLVEILIRFRRWPVALTADITKAFLQISMKQEDRDVHRFLLKGKNSIRFMRFLRVPFGNTASPFLLNATIKYHLQKYPHTEVVNELEEDMYVDNWLSGADSVNEACAKFNESREVFAHAGMPLSKWCSNNKLATAKFCDKIDRINEDEATSVLGLQWYSSSDQFSFEGLELNSQVELVSTKRFVLSLIARLFDPLGLISPFVMYAKILFQDIWRLGLDWDDLLPPELQVKFLKWVESSKCLKSWNINRCYFPDMPWNSFCNLELHAFGDASQKGYGACVYIRTPVQDGSYKVTLVAARSRVAPIKTVTLPRLELMGALLCARLIIFVRTALHFGKDISHFCWTDSKIALAWIQGDPCKWKMFVANRVTEIQSLTSPSCWHHCSGKDNPADLISRGILADQLLSNSLWLYGPSWLSKPLSFCQLGRSLFSTSEESKSKDVVSCVAVTPPPPLFDFHKWSHFNTAHYVVALVLRFINNCKPHISKLSGPLTSDEWDNAKIKLFYCVQREAYPQEISALLRNKSLPKGSKLIKLDPFLDNQDLLRIKGRLENAELSYESKHPIIIPNGHIAKLLISFQHSFLKHAGVSTLVSTLRGNFWIIGVRRLAKSIISKCVRCQRHDSRACSQPVAPLPELRVKSAPPFTVTGLDFAGPLFCADFPSKKFYILLFTCAVVRAVHLELTDSMSLYDCLLAVRRFIARRGLPSVFYSDNAKTFVAASIHLQKLYGPLSPRWKFIVPRSPWWGGWWERLVRSVKTALRKTLGSHTLPRSEIETTLHEVEACVNSRPLTYVGDEPDSSSPLSPSHFLIGRSSGFLIEVNNKPSGVSVKDLKGREVLRNQTLDKFWKLWSNDYITNLPPVVKGFVSNCNLKKGDIVLIKEDNVARLKWPLGVIVDVFPGKDGILRSVNVKTSQGIINRPIQRLHNLEISSFDSDTVAEIAHTNYDAVADISQDSSEVVSDPKGSLEYHTRKGRIIKAPVKLNL